MDSDTIALDQVLVAPFLEDYAPFIDGKWSAEFASQTADTVLESPAFELGVSWKGAELVCSTPWTMIQAMRNLYDNMIPSLKGYTHDFVNTLADTALRDTRNAVPKSARGAIRIALTKRAERFRREFKGPTFDQTAAWLIMYSTPGTANLIHASQQQSVAAIYFSYEHFLKVCYRLKSGDSDYWKTTELVFAEALRDAYGAQYCESCWMEPRIREARLVRHAISHNGGRETNDLKQIQHSIEVRNGRTQILPKDTRALFDLLKEKAIEAVRESLGID